MGTAFLEAIKLGYDTPAGESLQHNLSFRVESGDFLLITGPNGSGKSTLLEILLGKRPAARGEVRFPTPRPHCELVPQLQNRALHLPLLLREVLEISAEEMDWERVESWQLVHRPLLNRPWNSASGGERQRILLTRALLREPRVLLLDEPLNHLDPRSRHQMIRALGKFLSGGHRSVVMVSHQRLSPEEEGLLPRPPRELALKEGVRSDDGLVAPL